ncbi:uncharacterized protein [Palaemon carinicauda]|uniref:uncharacterized protein n=1 Tax=Palaemon carinicauda TaxID=392227 RepID=UPI0035B60D13
MPPFKPVLGLQEIVLNHVSHSLRKLCCDCSIFKSDIKYVIDYFDILLPPQIQSGICEKFLQDSHRVIYKEMLNEKYLYLCTELHAEFLWIIDCQKLMPSVLGELDGKQVKSLKMNYAPGQYDGGEEYAEIETSREGPLHLYKFLSTLVNLRSLKCSQLCNNTMLKILSKNCPNLEEISIDMCTGVDDDGLFHLCGFAPSADCFVDIRGGAVVPSKSGCRKLKKVNLEYTCTGTQGTAILLYLCPNLEELLVTPDVNFGDVFYLLHGTNPERHESVKAVYQLKVMKSYMELDEDVLSLITKTCPHLKSITLRCNGVERKDRNILANLLGLKIESLDVMNCSMPALLWYLELCGKNIESLTIEHLSMAPMSLIFTRTHLQNIIRTCPNLKKFTLKLNNNPIQPDFPYSSFGSNLLYFTTLTHLNLEGLSISVEDLSIFIMKCDYLLELHILILNLEILGDNVLYDFLTSGCLQNLKYLFLYRPLLTISGLRRLVKYCPKLQSVGPLSSWSISEKEREIFVKEIRVNNWDLNVASTEMLSMFHI